jgi:hypothetical protein
MTITTDKFPHGRLGRNYSEPHWDGHVVGIHVVLPGTALGWSYDVGTHSRSRVEATA